MSKLQAVRNWSTVSALSAFWWGSSVAGRPVKGARGAPSWAMHRWCVSMCDSLGIQRELRGGEHLEGVGQCVMVANHQSLLDIVVIGSYVDRDYRWLAKSTLFKVPFVGWHLALAGHVPVFRGKQKARNKELPERIHRVVEEGASLLFFPEGTRSADLRLQPFRRGAFVAAVAEELPVLPLVVQGTGRLMKKGAKDLDIDQSRSCSVTVLPPIAPPPGDDTEQRVTTLLEQTYEAIRRTYEGPPAAGGPEETEKT